jgi:fructoselysine-6-P-deglycase FrlB-like protein
LIAAFEGKETEMAHSRGFEQLAAETGRQFADARATWDAVRPLADEHAGRIRGSGRLLLLGMGGSHWVNRAAEPYYRCAGIDATAHVLSEYMRAPLPAAGAVRIVTSQSGSSGEVVRYLRGEDEAAWTIGMTLDPDSALANGTHAMIGAGGVEIAYAATRSLLVTLTMHAAILDALGVDMAAFRAVLDTPSEVDTHAAEELMAGSKNAVIVARGAMQGTADAAALSFMELARIPVLGLEAGQFRHGPFEMIDGKTAVIFLRGAGDEGDNIDGLARETCDAGMRPTIFDFSGEAAVSGGVTVKLPRLQGMAAAATVLPVLQKAIIAASDRMVPDVGMPIRSRKVTSGEAE